MKWAIVNFPYNSQSNFRYLNQILELTCVEYKGVGKIVLSSNHWGTTTNWFIMVSIYPLPFFVLYSKNSHSFGIF